MFFSTNSLSIVYTFSWEYISISSHIMACPLLILQAFTNPNPTISEAYLKIKSHLQIIKSLSSAGIYFYLFKYLF